MKHFIARCAYMLMLGSFLTVTACSTAATPTFDPSDAGSSDMNTAVASARTRQAQGQGLAPLCKKTSSWAVATSLSKSVNKYIVLDSDGLVVKDYQAALSPIERADSGKDATALVCVEIMQTNVESCNYTKSNSSIAQRTILRIRQDLQVSLIDVTAQTLIDRTTIPGQDPDKCPDSVKVSADTPSIYGDTALPASFLSWLHKAGQTTK